MAVKSKTKRKGFPPLSLDGVNFLAAEVRGAFPLEDRSELRTRAVLNTPNRPVAPAPLRPARPRAAALTAPPAAAWPTWTVRSCRCSHHVAAVSVPLQAARVAAPWRARLPRLVRWTAQSFPLERRPTDIHMPSQWMVDGASTWLRMCINSG